MDTLLLLSLGMFGGWVVSFVLAVWLETRQRVTLHILAGVLGAMLLRWLLA